MNTQTKPKAGRERLICHTDGKHYWLQSDGSMRPTAWKLINGRAVLTSEASGQSVASMMQLPFKA